MGAIEATALLQRVVEEVDIPLFAFDPGETLRLVNSAGRKTAATGFSKIAGQNGRGAGIEIMSHRRECLRHPSCTSTVMRAGFCGEVPFGNGECRTRWWCSPM